MGRGACRGFFFRSSLAADSARRVARRPSRYATFKWDMVVIKTMTMAMMTMMTVMADMLTKMMAAVWMMGVSDGGVMDLMTGEHSDALTDDGPLGQQGLMEGEDEEVKGDKGI